MLGYRPEGTPHRAVVTLPDLYAAEVKHVLVRLAVAAPPANGKLARVVLHYLPAVAGGQPGTIEAEVSLAVTDDPARLSEPPNEAVMRQVRLSEASAAWDEAVDLADRGDLRGAAIRLFRAAEELEAQSAGATASAPQQAAALRAQAEAITSAPYDATTRKRMRGRASAAAGGGSPGAAAGKALDAVGGGKALGAVAAGKALDAVGGGKAPGAVAGGEAPGAVGEARPWML